MKVLFAVNNESISESIIKKYQQEYKEIISVKNVYYFNAIIKELQRDKTYDRIVVSEDLQPFSNNNYDAIDKFIFEKMDSISDEATNQSGNDIPIILICTDRRAKSEPLLVKLFGIGVYNALIGKDRSITNVCDLLAKPRTKKEAKVYYRIDSDDVDYKVENEGDVSEVEIQNIINHYKKLGNNEQKYVESFEHIASQYTDSQLRLIAQFLPLGVKAVLEANSLKYQEVISFGKVNKEQRPKVEKNIQDNKYEKKAKQKEENDEVSLEVIENNLNRNKITEPVIIPSGINTTKVRKMQEPKQAQTMQAPQEKMQEAPKTPNMPKTMQMTPEAETVQTPARAMPQNQMQANIGPKKETIKVEPGQIQEIDDILESLPTGDESVTIPEIEMPAKQEQKPIEIEQVEIVEAPVENAVPELTVKRRGRPKKIQTEGSMGEAQEEKPKRGRGRPRKVVEVETQVQEEIPEVIQEQEEIPGVMQEQESASAPVNLFELGEEDTNVNATANTATSDMVLPGLENESLFENIGLPGMGEFFEQEVSNQEKQDFSAEQVTNEHNEVAQNNFEEQNDYISPEVNQVEEIVDFMQESPVEQASNEFVEPSGMYVEPAISEDVVETQIPQEPQPSNYFGQNNIPNYQAPSYSNTINTNTANSNTVNQNAVQNTNNIGMESDLSTLLTRDKKVVAFVGTSKNGTSFLVNNTAELLSQKGINTAILDLTKNKNAYYIYTENEEPIRQVAYNCMSELRRGNAAGIQVHKNLTVYTTLPGENEEDIEDYEHILQTLVQNYSLVILDCDFETVPGYFKEAQELYLVQSLDVLTIQPLTAFLRNLKAKNVLEPEKIRIVLNKVMKLRSISEKDIIGGMAFYNDPAMSFMTELFNKDTVYHCSVPFEEQAYSKYLEGMINCKISLHGFSKNFMAVLENLGGTVYPLISNAKGANTAPNYNNYNTKNNFSNTMNETLNKMKKHY